MDNNTEDRNKRLANVDTAMMWLGDAQAWMDMAERLDSESKQEQNTNPTNHHKRSVAHACTGLAFELAYKSLLVAEFKMPEETHSIEKLHKRLKVETQRVVEEWVEEAGWEENSDLLKFLDKYMAHSDKKYQLDNPWEKEKRDSDFTLTRLGTIPELAPILYQLVNLGEQNLAEAKNITPNQPDSQNALNAVLEIIREIAEKSANGDYIYRGEPKYYDKVSSTLYRQYEDDIEAERFEIEVAQGEMLKDAKDYIHETDKEFEILTQLQHYGGKTNLIDFTTDYLIALFFACDGFFEEPGRVILLREGAQRENQVKKPRSVINRVRDQKSIFARPPKGFIEIESDDAINIPEWLKQPILKHLEKYHGISTKTIYNDLHGFIRVQDLYQSAYTEFYKGLTCQDRRDKATIFEARQTEYEKSIGHYTKAVDLKPDFAEAYNNRGAAYSDKGDFDSAIEDYTKAIELKPDDIGAYYNRGLVYNKTGDYDRAIVDFNTVIYLKPDYVGAYTNRGLSYNNKGDFDLAIVDYTKATDLKPDDAEVYYNRGVVYYDKGDFDLAIVDYTKATDLKPDDAEVYYNRGVVYYDKGDFDLAIIDYTKAIDLKPDDASAYTNRGRAYGEKGDFDLAIVDYTKAIDLKPDFAEAYYNRGVVYYDKGDFDLAIVDYTKAIDLKPDDAGVYYNRGVAYNAKGDYDLAIVDCNKAIDLKPDYAIAYTNRGAAYHNKSDYDLAIVDCNKAIDLKPDYAIAYINRGAAYQCKGLFDRAIANHTKAITLNPNAAQAYTNRGAAYQCKGNFDCAIADYTKAIDLKPDLAETYANRGEAWLHLGEWEKAKSDLTAAGEMGADIITSFHNDYANLPDFEQRNGVKLPPDIAAMLTPQQ